MDHPRYFEIISEPCYLDKFVRRAFADEGYTEISDPGYSAPRTAIYIAVEGNIDAERIDCSKEENLIIITSRDTALPEITSKDIPVTVLRTPYIIGTGMGGLMRDIVAMTGRGTMFHIEGNDARVSVIHATDAARLAAKMAGIKGSYTVTDGSDTTWHDLIEALSVRVGHKRISTVGAKKVKWLTLAGKLWGGPDKKMVAAITTDAIVEPSELPIEYHPANVVDYLTNHEYTDEDL
ncbi:MAG: hypothetical protein K2K68_06520 [Duncaniella sp.]|nr:hypothetical protein [Duncaniella sp.]